MTDDPRTYEPRRPGRRFTIAWIVLVTSVVLVTAAIVLARELRIRRQSEGLEQTLAEGRRVLVTRPAAPDETRTVAVPATIRGFVETPVYAKIAGYLKSIAVDKGDRVAQGQVLAVLDAPEIDHQVATARANYELQKITDERNQQLLREGVVAKQEADQAHSAMLQAKATLAELEAQQAYETIRAPAAGVVTARNVDPGALVPQATTSNAGMPLVMLATLAPVRIYADVPQTVAPELRVGDAAVITVPEYPGREFTGQVVRRADALTPATRTMLVEVDVANEDQALYPGMYARATFTVAGGAGAPRVSDDALVFRGGKVYVPVVRERRLELAEVALGRDDGRMVEVTSGISPDDLVALNVGQAVRDGEVVQPVPAESR